MQRSSMSSVHTDTEPPRTGKAASQLLERPRDIWRRKFYSSAHRCTYACFHGCCVWLGKEQGLVINEMKIESCPVYARLKIETILSYGDALSWKFDFLQWRWSSTVICAVHGGETMEYEGRVGLYYKWLGEIYGSADFDDESDDSTDCCSFKRFVVTWLWLP